MSATKVYFASDFHLGVDARYSSAERERQLVRWLDMIKSDARAIYLVGDVFDFWFEYKQAVPRGYIRLLGKLAELSDLGIELHLFTGNHDMWMFDYLKEELNCQLYRKSVLHELDGVKFLIGHGDGLGPGDHGYKVLKKIFASPICQWLYARIHPNLGIPLARWVSGYSRSHTKKEDEYFGDDHEWLLIYANEQLSKNPADYFVFGHRHLPIDKVLKNGTSRYINLGEWMHFNSYAVWDGQQLELKFFENNEGRIYP